MNIKYGARLTHQNTKWHNKWAIVHDDEFGRHWTVDAFRTKREAQVALTNYKLTGELIIYETQNHNTTSI